MGIWAAAAIVGKRRWFDLLDNQFMILTSINYKQNYKTKWHTKKYLIYFFLFFIFLKKGLLIDYKICERAAQSHNPRIIFSWKHKDPLNSSEACYVRPWKTLPAPFSSIEQDCNNVFNFNDFYMEKQTAFLMSIVITRNTWLF